MKRYYMILFVGGLLLTNCEVLEKEPLSTVSPPNFFQSADDAESSLASAYDALQSYYGWQMHATGELPSDNVRTINPDVAELDNFTWNSTSGTVSFLYSQMYIGINRANVVIKYVPTITEMPAQRRDEIVGEAYFLRALHYFNLVRLFGNVPLRLEPVESGENEVVAIASVSADEVYAQIIEDLDIAESLAAESFESADLNRARANKVSVNALKAKVFLTLREWDKVLPAATYVLNSGIYSLSEDFENLFPAENQEESILEIQYSGTPDDGGNALPDLNLPSPPATFSFAKFNLPTDELIENYVDTINDERWKFSGIIYDGRNHVSYLDKGGSKTGNDEGYFEFKHRGETNAFNSPANYVFMRLGDVILMYAEASNELNGPNADALEQLNRIRTRASLPELQSADLPTKQSFRAEVDRQRRLELAFEGERWFDLLRYEKHEGLDSSADHPVTALDIIEEVSGTRDAIYLLLPIPIGELNNNPLSEQNNGY